MEETKAKVRPICGIKSQIIDIVKGVLNCGNLESVNIIELGEAVDMIKDLAEAEKYCWESAQAESIVKAMKEAEKNPEMYRQMEWRDMMGYNSNRYANGHYAPSGHGNYTHSGRSGYMPEWDLDEYGMRREMPMMMGYSSSDSGSSSNGGSSGGRGGSSSSGQNGSSSGGMGSSGRSGYDRYVVDDWFDPRHGEEYNYYKEAKRHYHESKSPEDKKMMDTHAKKHLDDVIETTTDIMQSSDPQMKKEFKERMLKLINDM